MRCTHDVASDDTTCSLSQLLHPPGESRTRTRPSTWSSFSACFLPEQYPIKSSNTPPQKCFRWLVFRVLASRPFMPWHIQICLNDWLHTCCISHFALQNVANDDVGMSRLRLCAIVEFAGTFKSPTGGAQKVGYGLVDVPYSTQRLYLYFFVFFCHVSSIDVDGVQRKKLNKDSRLKTNDSRTFYDEQRSKTVSILLVA